jgi:hypothetical protein
VSGKTTLARERRTKLDASSASELADCVLALMLQASATFSKERAELDGTAAERRRLHARCAVSSADPIEAQAAEAALDLTLRQLSFSDNRVAARRACSGGRAHAR